MVLAAGRKEISSRAYFARVSALTRKTADIGSRAVAELEALAHPRDRSLATYFTLSATSARLLAAEADALGRGDGAAVRALDARIRQLGTRARALARDYGFHECGGTSRK